MPLWLYVPDSSVSFVPYIVQKSWSSIFQARIIFWQIHSPDGNFLHDLLNILPYLRWVHLDLFSYHVFIFSLF